VTADARYPVYRWERLSVALRDGRGPERVVTDQPDPTFKARPVGFRPPEHEPQVWDGDDG
jgi:hypothetical protein